MLFFARFKRNFGNFVQRFIYGEGVNPLKWKILMPIFATTLLTGMTITLAFPFLPRLVKSFGFSEVEIGNKVGILGACLFIGRLFSSVIWGMLADAFNRRNVAVASGIAVATSNLAFGFSFNYTWAVTTRLFQGLSAGVIVIAKVLLIDMTDETNRNFGMSILLGTFNIALIVGSSVGGFLAFPAEQYPNVFHDGLFKEFGVLLPCGLVSTLFCLSSISILIWVPKVTSRTSHFQDNSFIESKKNEKSNDPEKMKLLDRGITNDAIYGVEPTKDANKKQGKSKMQTIKDSKLFTVFKNRGFRLSAILYCIYSFTAVGFDEIFPVYAATIKRYHGFEFSPSDIGKTLISVSVFTVISQFTVIPKVLNAFGARKIFIFASILKSACLPLIPLCEIITNKYGFWVALLSIVTVIRICMMCCFICINLFINNSVESSLSGTANGAGMSFSTLGRATAVPVLGSIFSWSLSNVKGVENNGNALGFPFNQYFVFIFLAILSLVCALFSLILPKSLDYGYDVVRALQENKISKKNPYLKIVDKDERHNSSSV